MALIDQYYGQRECDVCGKPGIKGVASIPFVPISVAYCSECLAANAHPWWALVANQAMMGVTLTETHPEWQQMVKDTCERLGKTLDDFDIDVAAELVGDDV